MKDLIIIGWYKSYKANRTTLEYNELHVIVVNGN